MKQKAKTAKEVPQPKTAKNVQLEQVFHDGSGVVQEGGEFITTNQGLRVSDDLNSEHAGSRGPTLLEDFILREKITHFDHERIPERVVHARGAAAHGVFQVYEDLSDLTQAKFLTDSSKQTSVFLRFSTVAGSRGSADTARDVRGFAVKFYTEEGNFDLVGNNIPVFFIQDAIKFPDLIHAVKPEPNNEIPQASSAHDTFYDFISLTPESAHMLMWVMSDRAIPRSYRMMEGFGVHTFRLVNAAGKARFVKFHWKPVLGVHGLAWDEAQKLAGKDPDFHRRDLWEAIELGHYPEWELGLQILEQEDEFKFDFDLLDSTKIWPEDLVPVRRVGKMTLNRNPDNYFAETEQVAFHLGHVVPGIDFTNDPLLQGRLFSYTDTQLTRLGGPNFAEIPINRPICPIHNYQRDGFQQQGIPKGRVSYSPNTLAGGCPMQAPASRGGYVSYPERVEGVKIRERSPSFGDHFTQARLFYNSLTAPEKQHIADAIWFELSKVETKEIQKRMLELYNNIDHDLVAYVAQGLGMDTPDAVDTSAGSRKAPALSMEDGPKGDITTRKVAILAADGVDANAVLQLQQALHAGGAMGEIVSTRLKPLVSADGQHLPVGKIFHSTPSVMYDAVFVPGGAQSVQALADSGDAVHFVKEAFKHGKPIGASGDGVQLLTEANLKGATLADASTNGVVSTLGVVTSATASDAPATVQEFVKALGQGRFWDRNKNAIPA